MGSSYKNESCYNHNQTMEKMAFSGKAYALCKFG